MLWSLLELVDDDEFMIHSLLVDIDMLSSLSHMDDAYIFLKFGKVVKT